MRMMPYAALGLLTMGFSELVATPASAYCDRPSYFHVPGSMIRWDAPYDCDWRHTEFAPDVRPVYRAAPRRVRRASRAYASTVRCRMSADGVRVCSRTRR